MTRLHASLFPPSPPGRGVGGEGGRGFASAFTGAETRTMPKPLFEYKDPLTKLPLGAIFGMSSTGTNPDLLLLIEARRDGEGKLRWEYAHARMTSASVRMRLDETEIWSEKSVSSADFDNWLFYFLRRDFR